MLVELRSKEEVPESQVNQSQVNWGVVNPENIVFRAWHRAWIAEDFYSVLEVITIIITFTILLVKNCRREMFRDDGLNTPNSDVGVLPSDISILTI